MKMRARDRIIESINSEYCITPIEALSLGQGLMIWLVKILSQCVTKAEKITQVDNGHDFTFTSLSADSSVKEMYAWAIQAASRIHSFYAIYVIKWSTPHLRSLS